MTGADQARETAHNENRSNIQMIKTETEAELERIKKHLNELYSREADALRTSRDHAEMERDGLRHGALVLFLKTLISQVHSDSSTTNPGTTNI